MSIADFQFVGTASDFLDLIIANLNRVYGAGTWTAGTCKSTDPKLLFCNLENCMSMMARMQEEFEGEFYTSAADDRTLNFVDAQGVDTGLTFQYKTGLFWIRRETVTPHNVITRLFAYGGERNIPSTYRDGATRLMFLDGANLSFVEDFTYTTKVIEATKLFDDIYPHRTGTITSVDPADETIFYDTAMDFNVNSYLLPGITAKIHFQTGDLAGYELELSAYDNATQEFTLLTQTEKDGLILPNATLKPAVGDEFVILDISMPASYIVAAETELYDAAVAYLADTSAPRVNYICEPDDHYFKTNDIELNIGDQITIIDTDLNVNKEFRIIELQRSVCYPYQYKFRLASTLERPMIERMFIDTGDVKREIALRNKIWITGQQLLNKVARVEDDVETNSTLISQTADEILLKASYGADDRATVVVNAINGGTVKINAANIQISGSTTFSAGYDPTTKVAEVGGTYVTSNDEAHLEIFPSATVGMRLWDNTGGICFEALVGGDNVGDVTIGYPFASPPRYMQWDKSAAALKLYGMFIATAASGARVEILPDANTGIIAYDNAAAEVFKVLVGGTDVGDVIMGSTASNQYVKFDKSAALLVFRGDELRADGVQTYFRAYQSGNVTLTEVSTAYQTLWGLGTGYNAISDISYGNLYLYRAQHSDPGTEKAHVYLSTGGSGAVSTEPKIELYSEETVQYWSIIQHRIATGNMELIADGDIIIDPAGGDVDFDACNICIDAGKAIIFEGVGGDTKIVYQNSRLEFFLNNTLEGYLDATGFVSVA